MSVNSVDNNPSSHGVIDPGAIAGPASLSSPIIPRSLSSSSLSSINSSYSSGSSNNQSNDNSSITPASTSTINKILLYTGVGPSQHI